MKGVVLNNGHAHTREPARLYILQGLILKGCSEQKLPAHQPGAPAQNCPGYSPVCFPMIAIMLLVLCLAMEEFNSTKIGMYQLNRPLLKPDAEMLLCFVLAAKENQANKKQVDGQAYRIMCPDSFPGLFHFCTPVYIIKNKNTVFMRFG